ncbi:site-specific DNA-methyltransferase [uncultured Pseudomonas sp.]|uniref:site-specific DNA-methyltransferase n=1 Tax=uncultured Pseudomonas sp. TaxID=114707 RepID=UPI0025871C6E|nr:site-specific DNA-methyltransferase [uncultured Pseudomonas sp.]
MLKKIKKHSHDEAGVNGEIIHGDNLLALQELSKKYCGAVRCVYIDPPYNNGEDYNHYMDNREHLDWLSMIEIRLKALKNLLSEDGSIWISIDDGEVHYLKVAADKIFGRENFITTVIWQQRTTRENRKAFSNNHEYILVYAKNFKVFSSLANKLPGTQEILDRYKNPDNDPRGPWQSVSANVQAGHAVPSQFYPIISPSGRVHSPPNGRCWAYNKNRMDKEIAENNVWFGKDGNGVPRIKKFLNDKVVKVTPETLWLAEECGTSKSAKKHLLKMFPDETVFDTPKPEELVRKVLSIATNPGDLVLDAFLGSGTTAAVAHKMGRRYIGIESGDHIVDIVARRLRYVVEGEVGGISKLEGWHGGGGFEFYRCVSDKNDQCER